MKKAILIKIYQIIFVILALTLTNCSSERSLKLSQKAYQDNKPESDLLEEFKLPEQPLSLFSDNQYCYPRCPIINENHNILISHDVYILNYNVITEYADWVAYKIDKKNLSGTSKARVWRADPKLPKEIAMIPADYKGAALACNYDRGHQAPLADFSNSIHWEKVNYLSNITPQKVDLNHGPWNDLESKIRKLAKETNGDFYIITGPYYNGKPMCRLPNARIPNTVPNGYWKIITLVNTKGVYRASFKFDQETPRNANFCNHLAETQEISQITKLDLAINSNYENSSELINMMGCGKS